MKTLIFTLLLATLTSTSFASQNKKQVKVRIQSQNGNLDEATVYFDQGVNSTYTFQEDAQKVFSGVAGVPVIYSVTTDAIPCSINGYGILSNTEIVPLGIVVDVTGSYNLTCPLLDGFDPTSVVTLQDRKLGISIDLRTNFYPVQINAGDSAQGRFYIHVTYPSIYTTTIAGCLNNDAKINVSTDPSVTWDSYDLFDAFNNPVGNFTNVAAPVNFTGLSEGDYYMVRTLGSYTTTQNFHINGTYIVANIGASSQNVATYENVAFSAQAINANHFAWDFGDGTLINGVAHPDLSYYEPGVYTVNLICTNDAGCSDNAQIQITVSQSAATGIKEATAENVSITSFEKSVSVNLNNSNIEGTQMQIYNLIGQSVYTTPLAAQKTTVSLNEQPTGYYLVSVKNGSNTNTKRVFIGN